MDHSEQCLLAGYGVLRISGADARAFLQGQLSNDLRQLSALQPMLAGLHNPQGRVLALLRLWLAPESTSDVLAALPAALLAATAAQLRRYVLRARVQIADDSAGWQVGGTQRADGAPGMQLLAAGAPAPSLAIDAQAWQ